MRIFANRSVKLVNCAQDREVDKLDKEVDKFMQI